jgi:alkylhydroperoxidase family enzyme
MARIRGVAKDEAPEEVQSVFQKQEQRYGAVLNTAPIYGLRPTIQRGVQALAEGIVASGLIEPQLRHLVCMRAASINGCPY